MRNRTVVAGWFMGVMLAAWTAGAADPETPEQRAARRRELFDAAVKRLLVTSSDATAYIFADARLDVALGPEPQFHKTDWRVESRDALFLRGTITGKDVTLRYGSRLERDATLHLMGKLAEERVEKGGEDERSASQPVKEGRPGPPVTLFAMSTGALNFSVGPVRVAFAPGGALVVTDAEGHERPFESAAQAQREVPALARIIGSHWVRTGLEKESLAALSFLAWLRQDDSRAFAKAFARMARTWTLAEIEGRIAAAGQEAAYRAHAERFRNDEERARASAAAEAGRREAAASEKLKRRLGERAGVNVGGAPLFIWVAIFSGIAEVEIDLSTEVQRYAQSAIVGEADADAPLRDYLTAVLAAADLDWRAEGDKVVVVERKGG